MNEWEKLQEENEARQPVEIKRRVEAAEAEVRIMHEIWNLLCLAGFIVLLVLVVAFLWTACNAA